jgi:putative Mn2+ efflux pump MntP
MSTVSLFAIAIGLAMDAFAVSVSSGVVLKRMKIRHALLIASFLGGFQGIMPFIGWSAGNWIQTYIEAFDHWIAFILLLAIGVRMIWESRIDDASRAVIDPTRVYVLFILAVATSIDALAVGLSLSFLRISIVAPVLIIGLVTFLMCFLGTYLGAAVGKALGSKIEALGGLILIAIGVKILIEHTLTPQLSF